MDLTYRRLNVFTDGENPFSGNGVAVFEDGSGLSLEQMQTLAGVVNTETVFILRAGDTYGVHFFAPERQTRFGGSASLAAAAVISDMRGSDGDVHLSDDEHEDEDDYTVIHRDGLWILKAPDVEAKPLKATPQILAALVGLKMDAIAGEVMTVDSGRAGIVMPVRTAEDVRKTRLDARMLHSYAMLLDTEPQVCVWANSDEQPDTIVSRMFFGPRGGVLEVAATGTGGANLGAWLSAQGERNIRREVIQGASSGRRSILDLRLDDEGHVYIGGRVQQLARGVFSF